MATTSKEKKEQRIVPFLWFDTNAEAAVNYYVSIFKKAKIKKTTYYSEAGPLPAGTVMTIDFTLEGMEFVALNGGPTYKFTEAISFVVKSNTQEEIDFLWDRLSQAGEEQMCGWVKDKYGLSWQIVPPILIKMISDKNPEKAMKVMMAMLKMRKLDIKKLKDAYAGK